MKKTEEYIHSKIEEEGTLHLTLIDPDEQKPKEASKIAKKAIEAGTDGIMVGGSIGAGPMMEKCTKAIQEAVKNKPVLIFPGNVDNVTEEADCLFYMSLVNSRNPYWITQAQALSAPTIAKMDLDIIPMAYLIVEPGGTVGTVGDAIPAPREKPQVALSFALSQQMLGKRLIYLEAGSGAEEPVPAEMIGMCSEVLEVPLIVGGGIRNAEDSYKVSKAGADIVVTGTAAEEASNVKEKLKRIIKGVKKAGKESSRL